MILVLCASLWFVSCDQVQTVSDPLHGTYIGYFHRSQQDTALVTLSIADNIYEGQSSEAAYPAIGKGSLTQKEGQITFKDSSSWSPGTDRTLILKGTYNMEQSNDGSVRIWRYRGDTLDEYILGRPVRSITSAYSARFP